MNWIGCLCNVATSTIQFRLTFQLRSAHIKHHSSSEKLLNIPKHKFKCSGQRSFSFIAPSVWNSLSDRLRNLRTLSEFKTQLNTFLFRQVFSHTIGRPPLWPSIMWKLTCMHVRQWCVIAHGICLSQNDLCSVWAVQYYYLYFILSLSCLLPCHSENDQQKYQIWHH